MDHNKMPHHDCGASVYAAAKTKHNRWAFTAAHSGWLTALCCVLLLYVNELAHHMVGTKAVARGTSSSMHIGTLAMQHRSGLVQAAAGAGAATAAPQASGGQGGGADAAASKSSSSPGGAVLPLTTLEHFPQSSRCSTGWMAAYAALHAAMTSSADGGGQTATTGVAGSDVEASVLRLLQQHPEQQQQQQQRRRRRRRNFVSVSVEAGLADRLAGLMTQFWHAVLTQRAFAATTYGDVPRWSAVCDAPLFDWTSAAALPPGLPAEAVEPLKFTYRGVRGLPAQNRSLPGHLRSSEYRMLYLVNAPQRNLSAIYQHGNLSTQFSPDPTTILGASNRGRSWALAHNPRHAGQLWDAGVPPADAFMCGFFALCSPVAAIRDYYGPRFWAPLSQPGLLKIGIQVRLGDSVFKRQQQQLLLKNSKVELDALLAPAREFFACAAKLEAAYAAPGQRVVWFLNSDSQVLRAAAKQRYGDKLLTDDTLQMTHPDCFQGGSSSSKGGAHTTNASSSEGAACAQAAMDASLQHSLGSMLTFSLADYHIITRASGFGRLGAWLSGRWDNVYYPAGCTPGRPVPPEQSAFHYSGV